MESTLRKRTLLEQISHCLAPCVHMKAKVRPSYSQACLQYLTSFTHPCVCKCECECICAQVCIHACLVVCACAHACACLHVCLPACTCACAACMLLCICACLRAWVRAYVLLYTCAQVRGTGPTTPWDPHNDHMEAGKCQKLTG